MRKVHVCSFCEAYYLYDNEDDNEYYDLCPRCIPKSRNVTESEGENANSN